MPQTFEDTIELLLPELQRRGLFWQDYFSPGATYRENIYEVRGQSEPPADHPAGKMIWRANSASDSRPTAAMPCTNGATNGLPYQDGEEAMDPASMQIG